MALSSRAAKDKLWKLLWTTRQEKMGLSALLVGRARLPKTSEDKLFWITDLLFHLCRLLKFAFPYITIISAYFVNLAMIAERLFPFRFRIRYDASRALNFVLFSAATRLWPFPPTALIIAVNELSASLYL